MKGIEWIKLATIMCEDEKMRLIDSMEYKDPAFYVWIRLLLQAGKVNDNGLIYLKEDVPYTNEMLSILFNRPVDIIEKVLEIFETFKMIEVYENNIIKICNWEKHQNIEGMKRVREGNKERVKNFRERKKKENEILEDLELNAQRNKPLENERAYADKNEILENPDSNAYKVIDTAENDNNDADNKSDNKNCNGSVTLKKEKREKDNKNKKKNIDREERIEKTCESQVNNHDKDFKVQASSIIKSLEEAKVNIKGLTLNTLMNILCIHKEYYVKLALDEAIERKKFDMNYINGILNNWRKEGYPKTYEEMDFEKSKGSTFVISKEKPKLRFNNFEPRKYDYEDLEKKLLGW